MFGVVVSDCSNCFIVFFRILVFFFFFSASEAFPTAAKRLEGRPLEIKRKPKATS